MKRYSFILFTIVFLTFSFFGQNRKIDSLKAVLQTAIEDTNRVNTLNLLTRLIYNSGDYISAQDFSNNSIELSQRLQFKKGLANALKNSGNIFFSQSNFPKALEYYLEALKSFESIGEKDGIGKCFGSIGNVYQQQTDYVKSLDYYMQALKKFEEIGNKPVIGKVYNNIGEVYRQKADYSEALEYYFKGLQVLTEAGDKQGMGNCYNNIGIIYARQNQYPKGYEFYKKALKIREEIGDKLGMGTSYNNIAVALDKMSDSKTALMYCDSGLKLNEKINDLDLLRTSYEISANIYAKIGKYQQAYANYVMFKHFTDSIFSTANSKKLSELKTVFEVEKKETELKLKAAAQQAVANEEKKRQQFIIYITVFMLVVVLLFAVLMFNRYKITKHQKQIIEKQKEIVEENQKQTIDSINYAKRIQHALLTSEKYIGNYLKDFFILFKPKDIVSGDFYCAVYAHNKFYLATADCTGHGVPGALMSMLGISFLNEIIVEKKITDPAQILNTLRVEIIAALNQEGANEESNDGMDISLCCFDLPSYTLEYACANNGLYIVRNHEVIQIKPDKMPVGKHLGEMKPFNTGKFQLQANDMIYTFTDGYADQFGGPKGKKLNYRQFEEKILHASSANVNEQKDLLHKAIEEWKGDLEQVDDVTVIGIRL